MNSDGTDDIGWLRRQRYDRHKRDCLLVDVIVIVADKDPLLFHESLMAEARSACQLPVFCRGPDEELGADECGVIHVAHAGTLSFS